MRRTPLSDMIRQHCEEQRLTRLFENFTRDQLRVMWDNLGDDDCFGPYDCSDIHAWMNAQGDGKYCAV